METRHKHKIDKIHLRINTPSEDDGHYLKDNAGKWVNEQVLSCLEDYIAGVEAEIGENIIQFDRLKISLQMKDGKLRDSNVCQQIKDQLDAQIRAFLRKAKASGKLRVDAGSNASRDSNRRDFGAYDLSATAGHNDSSVDSGVPDGNIIDPKRRAQDALLHFLKTGRCPWWMSASDMNVILEENKLMALLHEASPAFYRSLVRLLASASATKRLIRQFADKVLQRILTHAFYSIKAESFPADFQEKLPGFVGKLSASAKEQFWSAVILLLQASEQEARRTDAVLWAAVLRPVFAVAANQFPAEEVRRELSSWLEKLTSQQLPGRIEKILSEAADHETMRWAVENKLLPVEKLSEQTPADKAKALENAESAQQTAGSAENKPGSAGAESQPEKQLTQDEALQAGLIVENAGLILLNLYFKSFLQQTGLINEQNEFTDPELAVHVLHYLATGRQHDWDYNLLFEKFLCNVPLHESIEREREIPAEIKEEADGLLHAVVDHWSALGKSSIDLLRNEFLQRSGKLFRDEMSVRLVVERKTQDILIDRVPWGFSTTKLPWQKHLIYTTW